MMWGMTKISSWGRLILKLDHVFLISHGNLKRNRLCHNWDCHAAKYFDQIPLYNIQYRYTMSTVIHSDQDNEEEVSNLTGVTTKGRIAVDMDDVLWW